MSDELEKMFTHIWQGFKASQVAKQLEGTQFGLKWGIVTDNLDPLKLGRVQVTTDNLGGNSSTDWLVRVMPWRFLSVPVPEPGDLVLVGYPDGNSNADGYYLGFAANLLNPQETTGKAWTYLWDKLGVTMNQEGILIQFGLASLLFKTDEYVKIGYSTSYVKLSQTKIELVSPNLTIGTSPDTLTDLARWSGDEGINFEQTPVRIKGKEVAVVGAEDTDEDTIVDSGQS